VLLHAGAGILLAVLLIPILRKVFRECSFAEKFAWGLLAAGTVLGLVLVRVGTANRFKMWLYLHIALCAAGVLVLASAWIARRGWAGKGLAGSAASFAVATLLFAAVGAGSWWARNVAWRNAYRVVNPKMPAETMDGEGDGPNG
jgi:surface polysaccharide O-acyltransferase-like enzyme